MRIILALILAFILAGLLLDVGSIEAPNFQASDLKEVAAQNLYNMKRIKVGMSREEVFELLKTTPYAVVRGETESGAAYVHYYKILTGLRKDGPPIFTDIFLYFDQNNVLFRIRDPRSDGDDGNRAPRPKRPRLGLWMVLINCSQ